MIELALIVIIPFLVTLAALPLARIFGKRMGAWDSPDELGMHNTPVARSGGIAILLGIAVAFELLKTLPGADSGGRQGAAIAIGTLAFFFVGILDDLHEIKPYVKTVGLIGAALLFTLLSPQFAITGYERLDFILANVILIGGANALNFMDGMDGLASGMTVIAALGFFVLAQFAGQRLPGNWALIVAAASGAFWIVNKPPAKIFMGDCGSLALGASLAGLLLISGSKSPKLFMAGLVILSPLILDTGLAIVRRAVLRRDIFTGDRRHIYDLLYARNHSVWQTDIQMYVLGLAFALIAVASLFVPLWITISVVVSLYTALIWRFARLDMFASSSLDEDEKMRR
ncbi:MAG: MraY family glycosyltransferase [Candidatus Edwardsbacteria bacterium]|nr:MraY family glycosyltransferase [Candidatus Edwardsbacteria bacterium]